MDKRLDCPHCEFPAREVGQVYCTQCGAELAPNEIASPPVKLGGRVVKILSFYLLSILLSLGISSLWYDPDYGQILYVTEGVIILFTLLFAFDNRKEMGQLYRTADLSVEMLGKVILGAMLGGLAVNFLSEVVQSWFWDMSNYNDLFETKDGLVINLLFYCLVPAVFEEMAFRGFIYNHFRAFSSQFNTLIATSLLFAAMHFGAFPMIWLFPLGLALAWLRATSGTLWYSMILHFTYNLTILFIDGVI